MNVLWFALNCAPEVTILQKLHNLEKKVFQWEMEAVQWMFFSFALDWQEKNF